MTQPGVKFAGQMKSMTVRLFLLTLSIMLMFLLISCSDRDKRPRALAPTPVLTTITPTLTGLPPFFGVQTLGEITNDQARQRIVDAGIRLVRMGIHWADIEMPPGTYNWSFADSPISSAINASLVPLVVVSTGPQWAVQDMPIDISTGKHYDCGPIDHEDLNAWSAFIQALVERYDGDGSNDAPGSPVVQYWEIWNEPDNQSLDASCVFVGGCWGATDMNKNGVPDYQDYAEVLRRAYLAVKAANPAAQVIFGSAAYENTSQNCFNLDFANNVLGYLQSTYASAASFPFFDLMGFHFYGNPSLAEDWSPANILGKAKGIGVNNMAGRPSIKGLLTNNRVDKPLICTEYGRASSGGDTRDPPETQQGQSRYVVRATTQALTLWPNEMVATVWYTLVDVAGQKPFGLLDGALNAKSSWYAYQATINELVGGSYALTLTDTGVEGYVFSMPSRQEKAVLWATGNPVNKDFMVMGGQRLRVVRMYEVIPGSDNWRWTVDVIHDGGAGDLDGAVNGKVMIQVEANPKIVEQTP